MEQRRQERQEGGKEKERLYERRMIKKVKEEQGRKEIRKRKDGRVIN